MCNIYIYTCVCVYIYIYIYIYIYVAHLFVLTINCLYHTSGSELSNVSARWMPPLFESSLWTCGMSPWPGDRSTAKPVSTHRLGLQHPLAVSKRCESPDNSWALCRRGYQCAPLTCQSTLYCVVYMPRTARPFGADFVSNCDWSWFQVVWDLSCPAWFCELGEWHVIDMLAT